MSDSPSDDSAVSVTTAPSAISPRIAANVLLVMTRSMRNLVSMYLYVRTGLNGRILLITSFILTVGLAIAAAYILRAQVQVRTLNLRENSTSVCTENRRYTNPILRRTSGISLVIACLLLLTGSITYLLLRYVAAPNRYSCRRLHRP